MLVESGAEVNVEDNNGDTPLSLALKIGKVDEFGLNGYFQTIGAIDMNKTLTLVPPDWLSVKR